MPSDLPDADCSICGRPGKVRHDPRPVPVTSAYCEKHYKLLQGGYDRSTVASYRYFTGPTERDDTYSDVTAFYEFHGEWCVRQVEQYDGHSYRSERVDDDWGSVCEALLCEIPMNDPNYPLKEIGKTDFESAWDASVPYPS